MAVPDLKRSDITGFVLAGGKSERFGGDKRKLVISGSTLLERTIDILTELLGRHPYVVGDNLGEFQMDPDFMIKDAKPDSGPLGGLAAALERCETTWGLILAVDLPNITVRDLEALVLAVDDSYDFISLSVDDRIEPLIALYHIRTAPVWREQLKKGELMIAGGLAGLKRKAVFPPGGNRSLKNINHPGDLLTD